VVDERVAEDLVQAFSDVVRAVRVGDRQGQGSAPAAVLALLADLHRLGDVRVGDLAAVSGTGAPTASRHAAAAEELGLVVRRPDPDDRRACRLALTPDGARVLEAHRAQQSRRLCQSLADWSDEDADTLLRLLRRLGPNAPAPTPLH